MPLDAPAFTGVIRDIEGGALEGVEVLVSVQRPGGLASGLACGCAGGVCNLGSCFCEDDPTVREFFSYEADRDEPVAARGLTWRGGEFRIPVSPTGGPYRLRVRGRAGELLLDHLVPPLDIEVLNSPTPLDVVSVGGRVVDEKGLGIGGARLTFITDEATSTKTTVASSSGDFQLRMNWPPSSAVEIVAVAPGRMPARTRAVLSEVSPAPTALSSPPARRGASSRRPRPARDSVEPWSHRAIITQLGRLRPRGGLTGW